MSVCVCVLTKYFPKLVAYRDKTSYVTLHA